MGGAVTHALQDDTPARVIPSIVFNWNVEGQAKSMDATSPSTDFGLSTGTCEPGGFLGIEFRRDDSFARFARMSQRRRMFQLNRPFAHAVHTSGVTVLNVLHGTSAETMGLLPGDVIVEMDSMAVRSAAQLATAIRERCVGDVMRLRVHRGEQVKVLHGKLRSRLARYRCALDD